MICTRNVYIWSTVPFCLSLMDYFRQKYSHDYNLQFWPRKTHLLLTSFINSLCSLSFCKLALIHQNKSKTTIMAKKVVVFVLSGFRCFLAWLYLRRKKYFLYSWVGPYCLFLLFPSFLMWASQKWRGGTSTPLLPGQGLSQI